MIIDSDSNKKFKVLFMGIGAVLFLLLGILIAIVFFRVRVNNSLTNESEIQVSGEKSVRSQSTGLVNPETEGASLPFAMVNLSGKVISIEGATLGIASRINRESYSFKARVTDSTKLLKKTINKEKPVSGEPYNYFLSETAISFEEIKIGDSVVVESSEDVMKNPEFDAEAVSVIINP